jgi:hypothetical protein
MRAANPEFQSPQCGEEQRRPAGKTDDINALIAARLASAASA